MSVFASWRHNKVSSGPENFTSVFVFVLNTAVSCKYLTVWAADPDEQRDVLSAVWSYTDVGSNKQFGVENCSP